MLRTTAAVIAGKTARLASRVRGGGGSALPGLVVERIDPSFLAHALDGVDSVIVVTGTNGKTTTTRMLVAVLRAHGLRVLTNPTGSNFTRGVISSILKGLPLSGRARADVAVLELDEAHALKFTEVVTPTHALLLNVARDQLDRFAEIDATAGLLTRLAEMTSGSVVLNADDSFVSRIRDALAAEVQVRWFGVDPTVADRLPELQEVDVRFDADEGRPELAEDGGDALLLPDDDGRAFLVRFPGGRDVGPVTLRQRGLAAGPGVAGQVHAVVDHARVTQRLGRSVQPRVPRRVDGVEVGMNWPPKNGRHEVCYFDLVEDV